MIDKKPVTTPAAEPADEWPLRYASPARQALREIGVTQLTELTQYSEQELLKLHGVGPKAIRLFREALAARGLAFASPGPSPGS
jgi:DNA-directed RNA polymerase alpha subunit